MDHRDTRVQAPWSLTLGPWKSRALPPSPSSRKLQPVRALSPFLSKGPGGVSDIKHTYTPPSRTHQTQGRGAGARWPSPFGHHHSSSRRDYGRISGLREHPTGTRPDPQASQSPAGNTPPSSVCSSPVQTRGGSPQGSGTSATKLTAERVQTKGPEAEARAEAPGKRSPALAGAGV